MSNWFSKNLGDALLADEALESIKSRFSSAFASPDYPDDVAIFIRHESEGRLHCDVIVYFSPATYSLATAIDAIACNKPSADSLSLLVGSTLAWSVLFPDVSPAAE